MRIFANVKISEAIQCFADYVTHERRLAAGTTKYYVGEVQAFSQYLLTLHITDTDDITPREVSSWQMSQLDSGHHPGTVAKQLSALRAWFKYLMKYQGMERDVMASINPPKRPVRLPVFFKQREVESIYSDIFPDTFDGQTERLTLRMLYETGMRRSELASLPLSAIDLTSLTIKVRGKRNKERIIPIENELAQSIARYITLREEVLAQQKPDTTPDASSPLLITSKGKPVTDNKIYQIVERYMRPRSTADRTSPHVFRHTFATHMLNDGANIDAIKELLGHSDLSSTEIYTHLSREHLKESYKHAHPRAYKK